MCNPCWRIGAVPRHVQGFVSIGHSSSLEVFHTQKLVLERPDSLDSISLLQLFAEWHDSRRESVHLEVLRRCSWLATGVHPMKRARGI